MIFDVIIPVYKPDEKLDLLIKALLGQVVRPRSILCMLTRAGENTGRTADDADEALAKRLTEKDERVKVHLVDKTEYDHAGTRNLGVKIAGSDAKLFLMMTQDAVPAGNHLTEALISSFEDENVAAAYARQLSDKFTPIPEKCARRFNYPAESEIKTIEDLPKLGIKTFFCSNVCAMYRRDIFEKLGGFKAPAIFNEDMVYASAVLRNGYRIAYNAEAQVVHWHTYNLRQQFRRSFDNGASEAIRADVFSGVAPAKEGKRYVRETVRTLSRVRQAGRIPYFILQCGVRYIGFGFGKHYRIFPKPIKKAFSLNRSFWDKWRNDLKQENDSGTESRL